MVKIPIKTAKDMEKDADVPVEEQSAQVDETTQSEVADAQTEPADAQTEPADAQIKPADAQTEPVDAQAESTDADARAESSQEDSEAQETVTVDIEETLDNVAAHADETAVGQDAPVPDVDEEVEELDELTRLTRQLQAKEQDVTEHYEARLRLQAEFDNFKKRKEKESADFRKYANSSLLEDILTVVDDFERAIAAAEQTHKLEDFLQGVDMIFTKFLTTLQKRGVKEIEADPGLAFNPAMHEAVTQIETDDVEEGAIAAVFQKGYYLHDRVLRAPKVGVAKPKN